MRAAISPREPQLWKCDCIGSLCSRSFDVSNASVDCLTDVELDSRPVVVQQRFGPVRRCCSHHRNRQVRACGVGQGQGLSCALNDEGNQAYKEQSKSHYESRAKDSQAFVLARGIEDGSQLPICIMPAVESPCLADVDRPDHIV